jgi:hypothetical protein
MGIESVEYDKYQYQALLETTSYFWASKGGRGSLLEKIIALLGNSYSTSGITLSKIFSILSARNNENKSPKYGKGLEWLSKTNIKKLKFDLVNIIGDRLIILELKNRVDSGGTAAREEALSKKFFAVSRAVESEDKIFRYHGKDYSFAKMLPILGISKIEMILGFLFNINGKEATIEGDRSRGFYSSSRTHMKNYVNEPHPSITDLLFHAQDKLGLTFKRQSLEVSIMMLYGNEVIQRFTSRHYDINKIMEKVFAVVWDDIWLVLNIAIQQRAALLVHGDNSIGYLMHLKENDKHFDELFTKFCHDSSDSQTLFNLINCIPNKESIPTHNTPPLNSGQDINSYLADCLYAFASYIMSKTHIIKSRKRIRESLDLNKGVLAET